MEIEKLIKKINEESKKVENQVSNNEGLLRLQEVAAQYSGEYKLVWSHDLLKEIQNRPSKVVFPSGLKSLDELIGGFREQQLITLSASTKHGKTTFALFLVELMAKLNPVVIPLEQSNEELVEQRFENGYSVPHFLSPAKLAASVTVDWIEERIIEGIAKYNTKFVVIDHLGYVDDFGPDGKFKKENLAYRIGQVMKGLKNVAKMWNVVIVLLVHIKQHNEGLPPSLEDIKNSSDISQESDMVMFLWRKNEIHGKVRVYENKTMLAIAANRRTGKNGNVGLCFDTKTGGYYEDSGWVKQMEEMAMLEIAADEQFNS